MTLWIGRSSYTIGTGRMVGEARVDDGTFFVRNEAMRVATDVAREALISIDAEATKKFSKRFFFLNQECRILTASESAFCAFGNK